MGCCGFSRNCIEFLCFISDVSQGDRLVCIDSANDIANIMDFQYCDTFPIINLCRTNLQYALTGDTQVLDAFAIENQIEHINSKLLENNQAEQLNFTIDDILLNLIGTVIGFGLYRTIGKHQKHHASHISFVELSLYILVMFLGRFLLFNEMGIARLIYGF